MSWDNNTPNLVSLRALANPLRIRIVSLLTGTAMSATEVAEELGIAHASASYHLRQLASAGYLQRVDDEEARVARGRPRRLYRYDQATAIRMDDATSRRMAFEAMVIDLRRRIDQAERRRTSADAEVWLERDVWEDVCLHVDRAVELVHTKAVPPRADGSVKVSMTTLLLELSPTGE